MRPQIGQDYDVISTNLLNWSGQLRTLLCWADLLTMDLDSLQWQKFIECNEIFDLGYRWRYYTINENGTHAWLQGCTTDILGEYVPITEAYLEHFLAIDLRRSSLLGSNLYLLLRFLHLAGSTYAPPPLNMVCKQRSRNPRHKDGRNDRTNDASLSIDSTCLEPSTVTPSRSRNPDLSSPPRLPSSSELSRKYSSKDRSENNMYGDWVENEEQKWYLGHWQLADDLRNKWLMRTVGSRTDTIPERHYSTTTRSPCLSIGIIAFMMNSTELDVPNWHDLLWWISQASNSKP